MIKLGIIGAGTVFQYQIAALAALSHDYTVMAVCDADAQKAANAPAALKQAGVLGEPRVFFNTADFLACDADAVLISTPPATHFTLARDCLAAGKAVLLEKPAVLSLNALDALYAQAKASGTLLHIAYHAAFAVELAWLIRERATLVREYGLASLSKVYCGFYDPYAAAEQPLGKAGALCGSYIDSGVNALSVCDRIVDLKGFSSVSHRVATNREGVVIASTTRFSDQRVELLVDTDWTRGLNRKRTVLQYEGGDRQLVLDHSNQRVILQRAMPEAQVLHALYGAEAVGDCLFEDASQPRLKRQYAGVFEDFARAFTKGRANEDATKAIHRLLLENA